MLEEETTEVTRDTAGFGEFVGLTYAVTAGLLLMMTCCGWLIIFVGLNDLGDQLDDVRFERSTQLGDIKTNILEFDGKLEMLVEKMQRVKQMALAAEQADRLPGGCDAAPSEPASDSLPGEHR